MSDPIEIWAGGARIELAPRTGGAIASFTHRGRDVLRPTPREARSELNVRAHACYPLVPFSNRIAHAELAFGQATHKLARNFGDDAHAIHGVGWQRAWTVAARDAGCALLALEHRPDAFDDDRRAWPWPFDAWQSFALACDADRALLTATLGIRNVGDEAFPFGLGWHPYFPREPSTVLGFRADGLWQNDPTQLPISRVPARAEWSFDPPRAIGARVLDNVYDGWRGEATIENDGATTSLRADVACAFLVVYMPAARNFIAVEPVTHMTDAFNRAHRGEAATGMRTLAPGAAFSCTMQITSRSAA